jgi:hypothetical protein
MPQIGAHHFVCASLSSLLLADVRPGYASNNCTSSTQSTNDRTAGGPGRTDDENAPGRCAIVASGEKDGRNLCHATILIASYYYAR